MMCVREYWQNQCETHIDAVLIIFKKKRAAVMTDHKEIVGVNSGHQ